MCEIVKNWVGNMDNIFYYCREHKVECATEFLCPTADNIFGHGSTPDIPITAHTWDTNEQLCLICGISAAAAVYNLLGCKGRTNPDVLTSANSASSPGLGVGSSYIPTPPPVSSKAHLWMSSNFGTKCSLCGTGLMHGLFTDVCPGSTKP